MGEISLDDAYLRKLAENSLLEDRAWQDITTAALVPESQAGRAVVMAKASGVLAGLPMSEAVFAVVEGPLAWRALKKEGEGVSSGEKLAIIEGPLASILRAERVALNYLSHLSGVATATAVVVQALMGTRCRLRDTRKTIPGLRVLQKYAVGVGGGTNHRSDLADGILIKDNHLAALRQRGLEIPDAVRLAREASPGKRVEIEVTSATEAREAAQAGADELLLDNMNPMEIGEVVELVMSFLPRPLLEASGGITLDNVRQIALTGVDFISMGAITHSARALDLSLELEL